jgi:hypothetical protein
MNPNTNPNVNSSGSEHSSATPPIPRHKPPLPQPSSPAPSKPSTKSAGFNLCPRTGAGAPYGCGGSPDLLFEHVAPPTHPDRRLSAGWQEVDADAGTGTGTGWGGGSGKMGMGIRMSPATRVKMGRSKSMHHPSPLPPSPPAHSSSASMFQLQQRKRPESVQITTPTRRMHGLHSDSDHQRQHHRHPCCGRARYCTPPTPCPASTGHPALIFTSISCTKSLYLRRRLSSYFQLTENIITSVPVTN